MPQIFEIPINSVDASFKIRTVLEDIQLVLSFDWITRISRWNLDIFDNTETPLVGGLTLNINEELIQRFEIVGLPRGKLMLFDASDKIVEAGRNDLGDRCKLLYETSV